MEKVINNEYIKQKIKGMLNEKRYIHSIKVAEEAVKLAKKYGINEDKAYLAGILHDCARNLSAEKMSKLIKDDEELTKEDYKYPEIIHGFAGAILARNIFRIEDIEILHAIKYHTVGRKNMTDLEKIIYIADWIEPGRKGKEIENIREAVYKNLDEAVLIAVANEIMYLIDKKRSIHINTIKLRNEIIRKRNQ